MDILDFAIPFKREDLLNSSCAGQFFVREELSINEIQEKLETAIVELNEEGLNFLQDHFSTFFSILQKFEQCSRLLRQKGWSTIKKSFILLIKNLESLFEDPSSINGEFRTKMCNLTKMIFYLLMEFMKENQSHYVEENTNLMECKSKKKQIKLTNDDCNWLEERYSVLLEINAFLQYPVKILWEPPVVEEEFINIIANFCYNCLEEPGVGSPHTKNLREVIFEILGTLIKNYLHGLSFCVKIVQLLKMNDNIVNPLAQGIVHLIKNCKCSNIIKEIVREIGDTDGDQLAADVSGTRNLNLFLVQLAELIPETIIPAIDLLISHLNGDSYSMRICVIGVLGEIVLSVFTKENLDDNFKKMRDEYLDILEEHIHDVNAFVRVKVLQVWQKLCIGKGIPITRINRLLELSIGRLKDKSTNVKKQAVHLIKDLLEGNPFCCQLMVSEIQSQLNEEKKKLEKLDNDCLQNCEKNWNEMEPKLIKLLEDFDEFEKENVSQTLENEEAIEDKIDTVGKALIIGDYKLGVNLIVQLKNEFCKVFNTKPETCSLETLLGILEKIFKQLQQKSALLNVSPEIQEKKEKHLKTIEYLTGALEFAQLIDHAVPIILTFLDSNISTDILEAIHFFTAAYLFGFKKALEGVQKMLDLVFSKEANIKTAVSNSYKDIYFQTSGSGRYQSLKTICNLTELILKLNFNQLNALEEVVKEWVRTGVIDKQFIQVMFERFCKKISGTSNEQAWAALVLIRMVGAEESKVVKSNISVLLQEGLKVQGSKNFLIAKETCRALHNLLPPKEQGKVYDNTLRYPKDHEIIITIYNLLRVGLWNTNDLYYIPMADEAINLIFAISHQPDDVCKNLIVDIYESILLRKRPVQTKDLKIKKNLHRENNDDLLFDDSEKEIELTNQMETHVSKEEEEIKELEDFDKIFIFLLTRLISIIGQVASNYVLYLEGPVLDELKMRNQSEYEKKLKKLEESKKFNISFKRSRKGNTDNIAEKTLSMVSEDLEFNRVAADDMDAEEMKKKIENEIVTGSNFLARFVPLILNICKNPGKYNNLALQNATFLTLSKFMTVSSVFCEENLPLLVTVCEKSLVAERQENNIISLCALQYRFPNSLEPWTPHMYAMLQHSNPSVRYSSILVLTDLIVNEMIKVRSYISNLAICIVDKEIKIARVARHFFREYSQKGNSLYNVLPSLISNLTKANVILPQEDFRIIMKFILGLFPKERQSENLVEKICQYFESAETERQWSDLAYCLSLLNYNDKGLKKILDNMRCFANKLYLADVFEAFCSIISEAGKNSQKDKTLIAELETIVHEYRDKSCKDRNVYPIRKKDSVTSNKKKITRRKYLPSASEDEEEYLEKKTRTGQGKQKIIFNKFRSSFDEDDDEAFMINASSKKNIATKSQKNKENGFSEDSNSDEQELISHNKRIRHKKLKCKDNSYDYS